MGGGGRGSSSRRPREVGTYDQKPEMSAPEVAERFAAAIGDGYGFAIVNFANPDMVGHTGSIPAAIAAVEATDRCLGRVLDAVEELGGVALVTADHGNAETMLRGGRRQPAHRPHDEPGSARRHHPWRHVARRRGAVRPRADLPRPARYPAAAGDDRKEPHSLAFLTGNPPS